MFQIFCVRGAGRGASKQSSRKSKSCLHEIWSHRREQSPGQFHAVWICVEVHGIASCSELQVTV